MWKKSEVEQGKLQQLHIKNKRISEMQILFLRFNGHFLYGPALVQECLHCGFH